MGHIGFSADPVGVGVPLLVPTISLERMGGLSLNLYGYIVGTSLRFFFVLDPIFKVTGGLN